MNILVGYTGFVGSNIYLNEKFDKVYNSKNIKESYGENPDLLIYSGLRAEKFLANKNPEKDMELIYEAQENIKKINPKKLVLISTIDVFKNPVGVDENTEIDTENLHPYGLNRYKLECWVREKYKDALIVRLPALFGKNIKKNFIYDLINIIPSMLKEDKFNELILLDSDIEKYYENQNNGFYKIKNIEDRDEKETYGIKTTSPFDPPQNTKVGQLLPNGMIDNLGAISITQSGKYFYSRNFMYDVDKELGKTMAEYIEFFVGDKIPSDGSTKGKIIKKYMKDIAKKNNWMCIYQIDTQTDTIYMIYCLTENINYPPNAEIRVTIDPGYDSSIGGYIPFATHVEYKKLK